MCYHFSTLVPAGWLDDVTECTVVAIETMDDANFGGGGDTLVYALGLAEAETLPKPFKDRLIPRLCAITPTVVSRDPQAWGSYCAPPLKIVSSPVSIVADLLWDDLQSHLDYQIAHQSPEGTWEPTWTWGEFYPDAWQQARQEWRGHLTLDALTTLRAFGRIEA